MLFDPGRRPPAMNFKTTAGSAPPQPLARQSSVYSLTFDEFQTSMGGFGKDFGSMNMDELLKSIWTAEEAQAMTAVLPAVEAAAGPSGFGGLQRQGSLTLPRTLSQKTVDEVWRDLVGAPGGGGAGEAEFRQQQQQQQQRQSTLGEMTLEEFLVRAGVVREEMNQCLNQNQPPPPRPVGANAMSSIFGDLPASNGNQGIVLGFSPQPRKCAAIVSNQIQNGSATTNLPMRGSAAPARPYPVPLAPLGNASDLASQQRGRGGGILGFGDQSMNNGLMQGLAGLGGGGRVAAAAAAAAMSSPANQISSDGLAKGNGDLSSLSPLPYVYAGGIRGRKCSGVVEKVVERRQKRMIKNRESAARSRARKQAYTMELEVEIAKLKEQNQELQKKQAEILEMQKTQVLEIINQQHGHKKRCLRRTHTGPCMHKQAVDGW